MVGQNIAKQKIKKKTDTGQEKVESGRHQQPLEKQDVR